VLLESAWAEAPHLHAPLLELGPTIRMRAVAVRQRVITRTKARAQQKL